MKKLIRKWLGIELDIQSYRHTLRDHENRINAAANERLITMTNQIMETFKQNDRQHDRDDFAKAALSGGCAPEDAYRYADEAMRHSGK